MSAPQISTCTESNDEKISTLVLSSKNGDHINSKQSRMDAIRCVHDGRFSSVLGIGFGFGFGVVSEQNRSFSKPTLEPVMLDSGSGSGALPRRDPRSIPV